MLYGPTEQLTKPTSACHHTDLSMTGPYTVRIVFPHGAVEIEDPKDVNIFKVNGQRLKPFVDLKESLMSEEVMTLHDPHYLI